jgi:recombination protein RecR
MSTLPKPIQDTIDAFANLPGIGSRSAERLVFGLLKNNSGLDKKLANSLATLKESVHECSVCHHYSEEEKCSICSNPTRNQKLLCIVETPQDLIAIERTHEFRGNYHVLHGVLSPLNRVRVEDLRIDPLFQRIEKQISEPETIFEEIILATSGSTESEATALYISEKLHQLFDHYALSPAPKISRLARGIPSGGDLDYLDVGTLSRAMFDRKEV